MSIHRQRAAVLVAAMVLASQVTAWGVAAAASPSAPARVTPAGIPPNDDFADAAPVGPLPATKHINSTDATTQPNEPESVCNQARVTVWYKITPATAMTLSVDTFGSVIDTGVSVWKGSSLATLAEVACSYGSEGDPTDELAGRTAFHAKAGVHYYIQIESQEDPEAGGAVTLHVKQVTPPANDAFDQAQIVHSSFHAVVSNAKATMQKDEPAVGPCDQMRATLWYDVTPTHDAVWRADTFGTEFDTELAVLEGPSLSQLDYLACDDDTSFQATFSHRSNVAWRAKAGHTYHVQVGGYDNETGPIDLAIRPVTPPTNDNRGAAAEFISLPAEVHQSNRNATHQQGEQVSGCGGGNVFLFSQSLWFSYMAQSTAPLRVTISGDDGTDPFAAIFTGSDFTNDVEIGCIDGAFFDFTPASGTTYYFLVAGKNSRSGPMQLNVALAP